MVTIDSRGNVHDRGTGRFERKARGAAASGGLDADLPSHEDDAAEVARLHERLQEVYDISFPHAARQHPSIRRGRRFGPPITGADGREYVWAVHRHAGMQRAGGDDVVAFMQLVDAETGDRERRRRLKIPGSWRRIRLEGFAIISRGEDGVQAPEILSPGGGVHRRGRSKSIDGYIDQVQRALQDEALEHPEIFQPTTDAEDRELRRGVGVL